MKNVPSSHFILHEAHCLRFLAPQRKEPVLGAKTQEHCEQRDSQVKCVMCHQSVQKSLLKLHEAKECQERPVKCRFCELTMHVSTLETHEAHCGFRTERCPHCDQLILLWVLDQHRDVCQLKQALSREGERTSVPSRKICKYCDKIISGSLQSHYMEDCSAASEPLKKLLISFPSRPGGNQTPTEEKAVRPKTKDINRSPLLFESSTNQAPRDTDRPMNLPSESELGSGAASPAENEPPYDILKRCLQCGILLPLPILNQHEVKCRQLAFSRESR